MSRRIPKLLYDEVLELATLIAQPNASPVENVDQAAASRAFGRLLEIYRRQESSGVADPFLTETVADFTEECGEAVRLYELALSQASTFPGEPVATKHVGLARRLHEMGRKSEALEHLILARQAAFAERATDVLQELNELDREFAV